MKEHPFALVKDNKIIRRGFLDFPDREIGEVRESPESSIRYFEDRFQIAERKVSELEKNIEESENKGSYLMKLIHLKDYLVKFDGIGDLENLYHRLENKEEYLKGIIQKNRLKNKEIKEGLLAELGEMKDHYNLREAAEKIKEIKHKWIRTGVAPEENQPEFEEKFNSFLDHFNKRKKDFFDDRKKMIEHTIDQYRSIVEESKKVADSSEMEEGASKIKALQSKWKELGKIPNDVYRELFDEFRRINDQFFNRYKKNKVALKQNREKIIDEAVRQKEKILSDFRKEIDKGENEASETKNKYAGLWKRTGKFFDKRIQKLNDQFHYEIMKCNEIDFVNSLAAKKTRNFDQLNENEQLDVKQKLLYELISRDEKEFEQYNRNLGVFTLKTGSIDKIVNHKVRDKKRSLEIKKVLLEKYKKDQPAR